MSLSGTHILFWCPTVEEGDHSGGAGMEKDQVLGPRRKGKGKEGMNMCVEGKRASIFALGSETEGCLKSGKGRII